MLCLLCNSADLTPLLASIGREKPREYQHCGSCGTRFLNPSERLSIEEERARYMLHENDTDQEGYRDFVRPLTDAIFGAVKQSDKTTARGLDYGSGRDSAALHMLRAKGLGIEAYDPYFADDQSKLVRGSYDFIYACEVIEHFHNPQDEFRRLRDLLKEGGFLAVMTSLLEESTDFNQWHYRRDPTHVCFYSRQSLQWVQGNLGFKKIERPHSRVALFLT